MHEEAQMVITQHAMRTRVELMLEFQRGEWASWYVGETVRIYNEAYPDDTFSLYLPQGNEGDPKTTWGTDLGDK